MEQYEHHIDKVSEYIAKSNPGIKDDIAQIMRIAVWKNPEAHPALMKRMIFCRGMDFLKSDTKYDHRKRNNIKNLSYEQLYDNGFRPESPNTEKATDESIWITQMLRGLRESDRQLMVDYFLNELTLKEIAVKRGVTDTSICRIKRRCLDTLQRRHQQEYTS